MFEKHKVGLNLGLKDNKFMSKSSMILRLCVFRNAPLIAYRGKKITFFANKIRRLVILWKNDGAIILQRQTPSFAGSIGQSKLQPQDAKAKLIEIDLSV